MEAAATAAPTTGGGAEAAATMAGGGGGAGSPLAAVAGGLAASGSGAPVPGGASPSPATAAVPLARACEVCRAARAVLKRPRNGARLCKACFLAAFEGEVHDVIVRHGLFRRGERVAVGASGGKDSTVLAHVLASLNTRHDYGLSLVLLSIDEGITGYRDDSLESVKRNAADYALPLRILSYKELYGWSMDDIVGAVGTRNNCTFCGVFRRQALDRGARAAGVDKIATGHNADDVAETVLMNLLRGDIARLGRCVNIVTGADGDMPRVKPFKYAYEKEIVMYAYHRRLDYFSTECIYSPGAYRGYAREFIKQLEIIRPSAILDILHSAETWVVDSAAAVGAGGSGGGAAVTAAVAATDDSACDGGGGGDDDDGGGGGGGGGGAGSGRRHPGASKTDADRKGCGGGGATKLRTFVRVQGTCTRCGYMTSMPSGLCQACNLLAGLEAGRPRLGLSMYGGGGGGGGGSGGGGGGGSGGGAAARHA